MRHTPLLRCSSRSPVQPFLGMNAGASGPSDLPCREAVWTRQHTSPVTPPWRAGALLAVLLPVGMQARIRPDRLKSAGPTRTRRTTHRTPNQACQNQEAPRQRDGREPQNKTTRQPQSGGRVDADQPTWISDRRSSEPPSGRWRAPGSSGHSPVPLRRLPA